MNKEYVNRIADKYGYSVAHQKGIAIFMAHNSVNHNGNVHAAVVVNMNADCLATECVSKAEELKTFISNNSLNVL